MEANKTDTTTLWAVVVLVCSVGLLFSMIDIEESFDFLPDNHDPIPISSTTNMKGETYEIDLDF